MDEMPVNEFVEIRNGGYYLAGIRISLDSIAYELREGRNVAEIIDDFPALAGKERLVQGAIEFIHSNQAVIDAYLDRQRLRWEELARQNPLPEAVLERMRRYRIEKGLKSA